MKHKLFEILNDAKKTFKQLKNQTFVTIVIKTDFLECIS